MTAMSPRLLMLVALMLSGCQSTRHPPLPHVPHVDLARLMGDWYVIASIPTFIEEGAHNAVESYRLASNGTIETTFTFRDGGFDGKTKRYTPRGFVRDADSNAVWGMQFVWPVKADYRIVYLTPDYGQTVIGREKRDYLWIMARAPQIDQADYQRIRQFVGALGYDVSRIRKVPQRWESGPTNP
jgi:apolipoprotein D and lipocalin family protein